MSCEATDFNDQTLFDKLIDGGFGYGTICVPKELPSYIIMVIFPPAYVFLKQIKTGFDRMDLIIINFILTAMFYFPGLLHALNLRKCGSLTESKISGCS